MLRTHSIVPYISVVIPTYNREKLLPKTLLSIISQSYSNWECIIVDDFSTDNTKKEIQKYINKDSRFKYVINDRKKGAQGARNAGLLKANGEFIVFFDSDDIMHPLFFEKHMTYFKENPLCDVCTCYSHLLNDNNEITGAFKWSTHGNILRGLLDRSIYVDYNCVIRKTVLEKIGLLDEECPSFQEWDTNIRLAGVAKYGTVHELLVSYYKRSDGRISNDTKRELHGLTYIYAKHKKLWMDITGKGIYFSNIYSLALRISKEDKMFQNKMILLLPELIIVPFQYKIIYFLNKLWHRLNILSCRHNWTKRIFKKPFAK